MNDIPRGTSRGKLARFLLAQSSSPMGPFQQQPQVVFGSAISDSRLDDELSVATLEFSDTPPWLVNQDPCSFPKFTLLGTIWRGVDRHATDTNGRSEFIRAVLNSHSRLGLQYAEMLAEFDDTDVNIQDEQGRTALHWACVALLPDMVRLCLSVPDCATGLRDSDGLTAFDIALRTGDEFLSSLFYSSIFEIERSSSQVALLRVLTLSSDETRSVNQPLFPGEALFQPVGERNSALVVALLDRGVVLTTKDEDGNTALHIAAGQVDNVEIVTRLVKGGSDINAIGHRGATPLHNAVRTADAEMVELLLHCNADLAINDEDKMSALHLAAENGQVDIARVLLQGGADVGARDGLGRTVVEVAKANRKVQIVALLNTGDKVEQPVLPNPSSALQDTPAPQPSKPDTKVRNPSGSTDLVEAAGRGDLDAVRALLAQGADTAVAYTGASTALHRSAEGGYTEIIECLLAHGANIEALAYPDFTPLHAAVHCEQAGAVETLLAGGAQIDAQDLWGQRPLHIASHGQRNEIFKILLDAGAEVEVVDHKGHRPLHLVAARGNTELVQILISAGAETEVRTGNGKTPYQLAMREGHRGVGKLLGAQTSAIDRLRSDVRHRLGRNEESGIPRPR